MGKYLKGILGAFSGLVGSVVGATWNGIDVMRSRPKKSSKPPTLAQMKQRDTFALMRGFSREVSDIIRIGFQAYRVGQTPDNAAFSLNIENAVTGVYPSISIDYPEFVLSRGNLLDAPEITVATTEDAQLDFSWLNNADVADPLNTNSTDKVSFVVYNPSKQSFAKKVGAAVRSALSYDMVVPATWSGDNVHIWAFFVKADGKVVSDSVYLDATVIM
ncbi:MAG TPA: DUF6266 family protein [Pedobacter sp.]|uniref:DUF6266 family protein n=1 Tax=Pedobacter sp. TaxID=1411316 RepID=UPI002C9D8E08|nr:DUF6266 family protein [Pedobacter sp.]HMI04486.1 DUF6266 family protein [Pedobacter sp.]